MRTDRQKDASIRNRCKYVLYKFRYISFGFVYMSDNNDAPFTDEERKIFAEIRKLILILEKNWHENTIKLGFNRRKRTGGVT